MLRGFRDFVLRGNVLDLAVAVVIGVAFQRVVDALVKGVITPLVAAVFGQPDLTRVGNFTLNNAEFRIGTVLDEALTFLLTAIAVYFVIVVPANRLMTRLHRGEEAPPAPTEDVLLLREIRDLLATGPAESRAMPPR